MTVGATLFADRILDASVTAGVARLNLAQAGPEGQPIPAGQLIVPLMQLPALVNSMTALLKQVEAKMREQQAQAPGAGEAPAASAFRFS